MTMTTSHPVQAEAREEASWSESLPTSESLSPFETFQLVGDTGSSESPTAYAEGLASPFSEAAGTTTEAQLEHEAVQALLAELEDEEFGVALERLTQEAAARHAQATAGWAGEVADARTMSTSEVAQWLETVAAEADHRLLTLAERFGARTVESLDESKWEALSADLSESESPLAAQEQFFKSLINKVRKIGSGIAKIAGKGLSALARFLPIGKLLDAVRRLVRPLLQRVLGRAIGQLPAALQPVARRVAQKLGLEAESFDTESFEGETLTDEFDRAFVSHLLAPDEARAEGEAAGYEAHSRLTVDHVAALDSARERLATYFGHAEHQADPTSQMEQFLPAVLPLVKLGISIVGRQRVVGLVAGLIAKLIRPMVGRDLAPVLSNHLASSGLSLIGLEAESANSARLGHDALVSVAEDTIREVFAAEPEVLENELLTTGLVQEAFADAVTRHLPAELLREEARDGAEGEGGVWVMMPRRGRSPYRFRVYSRHVPIVLHRAAAQQIVLSDGETLEDRLLEAGIERFPAQVEVEAFETMPGGEIGHIVGAGLGESAPSEASELAAEFEALDEASRLNVLLPSRVGLVLRTSRHPHGRRYVRINAGGLPLRRRSPLSVHLDLSSPTPVLTVRVRLGERRAHRMAERLDRRQHVAVVAGFQRWVRGPMGLVLGRRLHRVLVRRGITVTDAAAAAAAARLADAVAMAFAAEIVPAATRLAAAAKDAQAGVTLAFAFTFPSRAALLTGQPGKPALQITPGWHRG